tara:strand:+ start:210 stop:1571 length:1362 start_codon:yes stop_codon:yes gene_type:complete
MKTFKQYLRYLGELTISPDYVMKGIENPFYDLDIDIQKDIIPAVGDGKIKFKNTRKPSGTLIKNYGGKFHFQINKDDEDIDKYITTTKKMVKSHLGQKQRKNATASSNVNEYLTVHFIVHRNFTTPEDFMADIGDMNGTTGVLLADGKPVTYEKLRQLIDEDETAIRDINIGYQNSLAVIEDLKGKAIDKLYWVPKGKPEGVGQKNPSDVIIKLTDGSFIGYSNKISSGADKTPKINTTITAYYEKLKDTRQLRSIHNMTHDAWNYAKSLVPKDKKIASTAINNFIIEREKFSETSSKMAFARLSKSFRQDRLNFYTNDYYYPFRNKMIELFSNHISESRNLTYFLNTVGYYTYDDPDVTPCPYKLLIGSEKSSSLREVSSDESSREIFFNTKPSNYSNIKINYDNKGQTFALSFLYKPLNTKIEASIVLRTRARGGWSGKALYITTPGFKKK